MSKKYFINGKVVFYFNENRLVPVNGNGVPTTLNRPSSRCLLLLLQRNNEVITQDEFINEVWIKRGVFTNTNTYFQNIHLIRKALKTSGIDEDIIKTVPKEGLKFTGMVELINSEESEFNVNNEDSTGEVLYVEKKFFFTCPPPIKSVILYISLLIMIILLLYVAKILTSHSEKNSFRFQAYKVVGNINGCAMKIQSKNNLREENEYLSFFKEKHIKCNSDETAYITMNEKKGLISVITCKKTSKDIKFCESNMYTE